MQMTNAISHIMIYHNEKFNFDPKLVLFWPFEGKFPYKTNLKTEYYSNQILIVLVGKNNYYNQIIL